MVSEPKALKSRFQVLKTTLLMACLEWKTTYLVLLFIYLNVLLLLFICCVKIVCNVLYASLSLCVIAAVKATGVPNIFLCKFPDNLSKVKGKNVTVEVLRVLQWAETEVDFIDLTACLGKTIISCFTELNCKFT